MDEGQGLFPTIFLHFLHPWRSSRRSSRRGVLFLGYFLWDEQQEVTRHHNYMDVGGRVMPGAITEAEPDINKK
jgi:hypothetical protein